jgi:TldD protein
MLLNDALLKKVTDVALAKGADFAEIYVEDTRKNTYSFLDGKPEKAISGHMLGAGIRLFIGTEQIYTYTNDLSEQGLIKAARLASEAMSSAQRQSLNTPKQFEHFGSAVTLSGVTNSDKWEMLRLADEQARGFNSLITQVIAEMSETQKTVQIFNSEGVHRQESRAYLHALVRAIAEENGNKEVGYDRTAFLGTAADWQKVNFKKMALSAAGQSLRILRAAWAPAGEMPVVLDNAFGGVIFHEACGHGLETTSVAKNASVFCGKLGQAVGSPVVTAIDDGTLEGENGTLEIDDEGESTKRTVLIEKGILKSYIVDKIGARRTGYAVTGSGRRQDYRYAPTSRMRNTFIAPGDSSFEEMIKDIDYGLYAKDLGGGSVVPGTGSYNFAVNEGYLIKNGQIEGQVKGASLIGTGIETLGRITKVSKDFKLSPGTCGSVSGMIPVTVGQPQLLVSKLTVGGKV